MRLLLLSTLLLAFSASGDLHAQNCRKGKPCGNSCIARAKVCRVGEGTARWAPGADTTSVAQQARPLPPKPGDSSPALGPQTVCVVAAIVDGDTMRCMSGPRVRLLLIDAPERDQGRFGTEATKGLKSLVSPGAEVRLEFDVVEYDRYRRRLAYAYLSDNRMINEEMARMGLVMVSVYPPNVKYVDRIRAAVDAAKKEKRGLWATSAFNCPPGEHRRGYC